MAHGRSLNWRRAADGLLDKLHDLIGGQCDDAKHQTAITSV
jgi:hypothetical protein